MMIPHHQGAIDMAQAELRYGKNEQLRRIAQEIIVEQQQEIAAMRLALGQPLPPPRLRRRRPAPRSAAPTNAMPMPHDHGAHEPIDLARSLLPYCWPHGSALAPAPGRRPAPPPRPTSRSATATASMPPSSSPTPSRSPIPSTTSCSA